MATLYRYACPSCGYEARVAGGKSALMMAKTQTFRCNDCKTLQDIATEVVDPESESGAWPDWLPVDDLKCRYCGSRNVEPWDGLTCPKCGSKMVKDEEDLIMAD